MQRLSYKDFAGPKPAWLFDSNQRTFMNDTDPQPRLSTNEPYAAFVGLDWADEKHAVALLAAGSQTKEHTTLEHTPEALSDWVAQLHQRFAGGKIAIILEQSRGSLLYALLPHVHLVLYPINPQMAAKFRKAFYPSGAKDDPLDADLLLEILLQHRDRLILVRFQDETNYPRPGGEAAQAGAVIGQATQALFETINHPTHVIQNQVGKFLLPHFIPNVLLGVEFR